MAETDLTQERRWQRLRDELADERVPLPVEGPAGRPLLAELQYARRPPVHENRGLRYGALVFAGVPDWDRAPQVPLLVPAGQTPLNVLRRFADGRSSFTVATAQGVTDVASFEHSLEDEVAAVQLQRAGATVVQRIERGLVRVSAPSGVVLWNGSRWLVKPLADDYVRVVARLVSHGDRAVLAGLLEFAVHSLSAARVGATLIWNVDGRAVGDRRGGLAEFTGAVTGPPLSVARRSHFAALLSAQSQFDLATVVAVDGAVGPIGVRLDHTREAARLVAPLGGARHTSARRFTFDVPGVLAVVVSEAGRVTVISGGGVVAEISADKHERERSADLAKASPRGLANLLECPNCAKTLLVELDAGEQPGRVLRCPVCEQRLDTDFPGRVVGVPVTPSQSSDAVEVP